MKNAANDILQVANRKTSVKLTVELTREVDNALDEIINGLPKMEGVAVTKENVIVAATENYLAILRRDKNKKSKVKKSESGKTESGKAEKTPSISKQETLLDLENDG